MKRRDERATAISLSSSKRHLASAILSYVPNGTTRLIEPFGGSAALSLAALATRKVSHVVIADSDQPLMALWNAILWTPEALAEGYRALWEAQLGQERLFYERVRDAFNRQGCPDQLLYLLARCVKALCVIMNAASSTRAPIIGAKALSRKQCASV